jgi:AcrR family transcriptional regulator
MSETSQRRPTAVRKQEIARIAARLFAAQGFHRTGINELAQEVGLGKGALYYHIKSKEDLLYEISTAHVLQMIEIGEELSERRDLTPTEKLRQLSRSLMITIGENRAELTVFFREFQSLTEERAEAVRAFRDRFEQIWTRVIEEGVANGEFRPIDRVAIKALLGLHNYSYIWLDPDGRCTPEQVSEVFMDLILNGIAADQSSGKRTT